MVRALNELVDQVADPLRKVAKVFCQIGAEAHEGDVR